MAELILPSNVEAERSVLGSALIDKSAADTVMASLSEDAFSGVDERNVLVFRAMNNLYVHHDTIDPQTVNNELVNMKIDKAAGGAEYLLELMNSQIVTDHVDHYIKIVKDQKVLREYLLALQDIQVDYSSGKVTNISDFLGECTMKLNDISNKRSVGSFRIAGEIAKEVNEKIIKEANRADKGLTGVDTGFSRLNDITNGWKKGELIILAARPSVGKTALALNFALNAAKYQDKKTVAFFSGEMSNDECMRRILSSESKVRLDDISKGKVRGDGFKKLSYAVKDIEQLKLYVDDTPNPKLGDIVAKTTKLKNKNPDLCLILIDYLNRIKTDGKHDSRSTEIAEVTSTLKQLARDLNIPVVCLAQINRDAEENVNGVPSLSNLKESGAIEEDADIVMLLYNKAYYERAGQKKSMGGKGGVSNYQAKLEEQLDAAKKDGKSSMNNSITTVIVAKNRNGRSGKVSLLFSADYQKFDQLDLETEEALDKNESFSTRPSPDD